MTRRWRAALSVSVIGVALCAALVLLAARERPGAAAHTTGHAHAAATQRLLFRTTGAAVAQGGRRTWRLAVMDATGGHRRLLVEPESARLLGVSQHGDAVAFAESGSAGADHTVGVIYLTGAPSRTFQVPPLLRGNASWFPDDVGIAFSWMVPAPGEGEVGLATRYGVSELDLHTGRTTSVLANGSTPVLFVAVSPDGQRIAFCDMEGLAIVPANGEGEPQRIHLASAEGLPDVVSWSSSGQFLACRVLGVEGYQATPGGLPRSVHSYALVVLDFRAAGEVREELMSGPQRDLSPGFWHPREDKLAYVGYDSSTDRSLVTFSSYERGRWGTKHLEPIAGRVVLGGWSGDGSLMAYSQLLADRGRIYVAKADGANAQAVSPSGVDDSSPWWVQ